MRNKSKILAQNMRTVNMGDSGTGQATVHSMPPVRGLGGPIGQEEEDPVRQSIHVVAPPAKSSEEIPPPNNGVQAAHRST